MWTLALRTSAYGHGYSGPTLQLACSHWLQADCPTSSAGSETRSGAPECASVMINTTVLHRDPNPGGYPPGVGRMLKTFGTATCQIRVPLVSDEQRSF